MRRTHRVLLLVGLMTLAPVLAGCADFDMDSLDFLHLNDKKKLPGERKELFPEGVPGVTQGIPPEYLKGNQPQPDTAMAPAPGAAAVATPSDKSDAPAPAAKTAALEPVAGPKPKPKRKPKAHAAQRPPKHVTVQPVAQGQGQPQANDQQQLAPWPGAAPQQPAAGPSPAAPWPAAPAPGTFSQ
jgi:hypothetical protein